MKMKINVAIITVYKCSIDKKKFANGENNSVKLIWHRIQRIN